MGDKEKCNKYRKELDIINKRQFRLKREKKIEQLQKSTRGKKPDKDKRMRTQIEENRY